MDFNRQTVKSLLLVVCGGIAFYAAVMHLSVVAHAVGWLLGIFAPLKPLTSSLARAALSVQ